ncbi:MAG: DEAD/DEAH box helicase family protein [Leptospiraceae bacterium]|nr:DEAD/DEAH box helicase family protein [Leptospiraceae bacterium]
MAKTYYSEHEKELKKQLEKYKPYLDSSILVHKNDLEAGLFRKIEKDVFRYPLRYYQMEAIFLLDYFMKADNSRKEKKALLEKSGNIEIPFMGYEMATGSGKTALMGACIYYLNENHNIKNFLIITPKSLDIYNKTIQNFSLKTKDTIWANDTLAKFNLITGDDYNRLFFDDSNKLNIFIFNIDKFGKNAVKTDKTWESSSFRDKEGNTISVREYLNQNDLVIITDEAHHAQAHSGSSQIIKSFSPKLVLEFTATALENPKNDEKRAQKVIYKYDIQSFLNDGYGKVIRAVALDNQEKKVSKKERKGIPDSEKWKLITLFLFHFLKKEGVPLCPKTKKLKPISLIKIKDEQKYAEVIYKYVTEEIYEDIENISFVLKKIQEEEIDVIPILRQILKDMFHNDPKKIAQEMKKYSSKVLLYSGTLTKETKKEFEKIQSNLYEMVVYIYRLDEGIDLPNIFTIAVVNDNESDFKTAVKQIIGRGVRLGKERRLYDDEPNLLLRQSEQLHIICDKGKNFENMIAEIKEELNLDDNLFSHNSAKEIVINKVKKDLIKNITIPKLKASDKVREGTTLSALMSETEKIVDSFISHNCSRESESTTVILKYIPSPFFTIVDIFDIEKNFIDYFESRNIPQAQFSNLKEKSEEVFRRIVKIVPQIPDSKKYQDYIFNYLEHLESRALKYFYADEADHVLAEKRFLDSFTYFFNSYIHKHYYKPDYRNLQKEEEFILEQEFKEREIFIPKGQISKSQKKILEKIQDEKEWIQLIQKGFYFNIHNHSIYEYNKFASLTEKQMADYLDWVINNYGDIEKDFWIKNEREIYFEYGNQKYFPDFLFHHSDMMNIIETKGEYFSNAKKNQLLEKLKEIENMRGLLIYSKQMNEIVKEFKSFNHLLGLAEQSFQYESYKNYLVSNVEEEEKYTKYLPIYSAKAAAGAFGESSEVNPEGWLPVKEKHKPYPKTQFLIQVKGLSMYPKINDGAICLFDNFFTGSKNGQIVLVQHRTIEDPDGGGKYTVKEYESKKIIKDGLFKNERITLKPMNRTYKPIILENVLEDEILFIGVFKEIVKLKD